MAEVMDTVPTSDGKVRDVTLRYKAQTGKSNKYNGSPDVIIKRSVHRLVLLQEAEDENAARADD